MRVDTASPQFIGAGMLLMVNMQSLVRYVTVDQILHGEIKYVADGLCIKSAVFKANLVQTLGSFDPLNGFVLDTHVKLPLPLLKGHGLFWQFLGSVLYPS